jgi:hypothetical protein
MGLADLPTRKPNTNKLGCCVLYYVMIGQELERSQPSWALWSDEHERVAVLHVVNPSKRTVVRETIAGKLVGCDVIFPTSLVKTTPTEASDAVDRPVGDGEPSLLSVELVAEPGETTMLVMSSPWIGERFSCGLERAHSFDFVSLDRDLH